MKAFDPSAKIPESLIEAFVDKIVFDKGVFSWYLNPKFGNEVFDMDTTDWKKSMLNRKKTDDAVPIKQNYYSPIVDTDKALFLGTYEIPKEFINKSSEINYGAHRRFRLVGEMVIKVYLV